MEKLKYGIIGFGGIAENRIAKEGFGLGSGRSNPSAQLVAAMDLNPERAPVAKSLGLKWFGTVDEILDNEDVKAVFIATSNSSHVEIAEKAILKRKHCLIEKPVATTISDAEKLVKLAKENNVSIMVDHMMRENSYNIEAKKLIASGSIGAVNDIELHMEFSYGSTLDEASAWRCSDSTELGGPIGDVGSHCLYMAEFLLKDRITEISCVYTPETYSINVENGAVINIKTEKGIMGSISVAFNKSRGGLIGTLSNLGFEVYGTEGVLRSFGTLFQLSGHNGEPYKMRLEVETANGVEIITPRKVENIYKKQIEAHVESIRKDNYSDGVDALHNLKMLFACHESASGNSSFIKI